MKILNDPNGYAVNVATGTVHTRYAGDHAGDTQRTRTVEGAESLLAGQPAQLCRTCYPDYGRSVPDVEAPRTGQVRRSAKPSEAS